MKNIAVIGKSGQLAKTLESLNSSANSLTCFGRNDINLQEVNDIIKVLSANNSEAVINASAYTAVDNAETDKAQAFLLNENAIANLAQACKTLNLPLVHVSTDYVFKGDKGAPYLPSDEIAPTGVYGASKAAGEQRLMATWSEKSCVIRTSWVYSNFGNNFVFTMLKLMASKDQLGVISDQIGSPTNAEGLANACIAALTNQVTGIHHYTDLGVASWYDFAVAIQQQAFSLGLLDKVIPIKAINTEDYPTPAKRPHYSVLDKKSLQQALPELEIKHWQQALTDMLSQLKAKS